MPTYEYVCRSCGHAFEVVRSIHDDPLTVCPDCGGELRRVFAPPAIAFKGSGFYATDHRRSAGTDGQRKDEKKDEKRDLKKDQKKDTSETTGGGDTKHTKTPGGGDTKKETSST
jgi:putative FmdB family regulatory protein